MVNSEFYISARERFIERLPDNTAAFIFSGESRRMSQDDDYPFFVDRNFFYLTGLELPGLTLRIVKKDGKAEVRLYAFVHNDYEERWHGKRPGFDELSDLCGIDESDIEDQERYEEQAYPIVKDAALKVAYDGSSIMKAVKRFRTNVAKFRAADDIIDIKDVFLDLRIVKNEMEADLISYAAQITEEAIAAMKEDIRPGVTEYDLHTRLEYEMKKRGSEIFAFATIVSSGINAFYLHHGIPERTGDGIIKDGSFIQIDVGARYKGYCADISRVFFVGYGDKEDDKRIVLLDLIRELRKTCKEVIKTGMTFNNLNKIMHEKTFEFLKEQGLASEEDESSVAAHKYYWHNTSHHLGLDVHDLGNSLPQDYRDMPFRPGFCLAVEPGVYIPEWGVGFRIEDDIMVTEDGNKLLSSWNKDDIPEVIFC